MQLNNIEVKRYDMISVAFPAGTTATKLIFPDQPQLRGAKVHGIDVVYTTVDINGIANINYVATGIIQNTFLTLYFNGEEGIKQIPLAELTHIQGNNTAFANTVGQYNTNGIMGMAGQVITWTKSYLTLAAPTPPAVNSVYVIGVYYTI
jgi:hypothetical protein